MAKQQINSSQAKMTVIDSNFALSGTRYATSSATFADVTNISHSIINTSASACNAILTMTIMAQKSGGGAEGACRITVNGVAYGSEVYYNPATSDWVRGTMNAVIPIPAGATIAVKLQARSVGVGTFSVVNETANWMPKLTGMVVGA